MHRGPNGGESLEDHFDALRWLAAARRWRTGSTAIPRLPGARHCKAPAQLGKLFKNGAIDKTYWAWSGRPDADEGEIACRSAA